MKRTIIIFLIFQAAAVYAQRLNFGFGVNYGALYFTHFKEDVVFAKHSFRAYYVEKNQTSLTSDLGYNFITCIDYGRFLYTVEAGYFTTGTSGLFTKLAYPVADENFNTYYSKITFGGYKLRPLIGFIVLPKRFFKLYAEAGITRVFLTQFLVNEELSNKKKDGYVWRNQDEIKSELGLTENHLNAVIGAGFRTSFFSVGIRYENKLNKSYQPKNNLGQLTFYFSGYANFSKLKKHYIYVE